jgi:hypothetical protein
MTPLILEVEIHEIVPGKEESSLKRGTGIEIGLRTLEV